MDIAQSVSRHGWPLTLLVIFLAGMALNLTPCVYPLIPVTIGFFGNQAQGAGDRRQRTLMLAIVLRPRHGGDLLDAGGRRGARRQVLRVRLPASGRAGGDRGDHRSYWP